MHQQQGLSQYDFANNLLIATGHDANSLYSNGPIVLLMIK